MKVAMRVGTLLTLAALTASCGAGSRGLTDAGGSATASSTIGSHGQPVTDHVSFVDALRRQGFRVVIGGSIRNGGLEPVGTRLELTGGGTVRSAELESYNYDGRDLAVDAAEALTRDTARIAAGGTAATPTGLTQVAGHWYRVGHLLVLYVGSDPAIERSLQALLGPQFAGT